MENGDVLLAIGNLQGEIKGISREIKEVKSMLDGNNKDSLCGRLSYLEQNGAKISQENAADIVTLDGRVSTLENSEALCREVEVVKKHWIDTIYAKAGFLITAALTIYNSIRPLFH